MKELLLVSIGSFFGGGTRYLVSKAVQSCMVVVFPFGTMAVNVLGCLVIGFLSALPWHASLGGNGTLGGLWPSGWMTANAKLLLTTGFCGGFTTFSTFMNESSALLKDGHEWLMALYVVGSLAFGFLAILVGQQLAKALQ